MRVSATQDRHSEDDFSKELIQFSDAGAGIIQVRTSELLRATVAIRKSILAGGNPLHEWDIVHGWRDFELSNMFTCNLPGDKNIDFFNALERPLASVDENIDDGKFAYFIYVNPQYWLDGSPVSNHWLQMYSHLLPSTQVRMILLTPDEALPEVVSNTAVSIRFEAPGHEELSKAFDEVLAGVQDGVVDLDQEQKQRICHRP